MQVAERVAFVRKHMCLGFDRTALHEAYADFYGSEDASERTIDQYIAKVHSGWLRDADEREPDARERERQQFLIKLEADATLYKKHSAWASHAAVRRLEARVRQLDAQEVNVRGGLTLKPGRADDEPLAPHEITLAVDVLREEQARLALPEHAANDETGKADP